MFEKQKSISIVEKIISWLVCFIPLILIFSNSIADIVLVISSLFFIFISIKNNNWIWTKELWVKFGFITYIWLIISSFFAYDPELALSRSLSWVRFIIFAASLQFFYLNNKKNLHRLIMITFIALIYVNIEMFVEQFTGYSLYSRFREYFLNAPAFLGGPHRISGPFKDAPKSGIFLAYFVLPVAVGIAYKIKSNFSKFYSEIFTLFFLSVNFYLVYESGHRASILAVFISFFLLICYSFFKKRNKIFFPLIITTAILFSIFNSINKSEIKTNLFTKTIEEIKNYPESAYGALSSTAIKMFKHKPIFGIGLKNYRVACEKDEFLSEGHLGSGYGVSPWKGHYNVELQKYYQSTCSGHIHNLYLTWLAETGFLGFILFLTILFSISKKIFNSKEIISNNFLFIAILVSIIPKLIPMMPSLNFFSNWNAICFWFLIGWLLSSITRSKPINSN